MLISVFVLPRGRPAGFTLVEMLCVLVVLGLASALVLPAIGSRDDLMVSAASRTVMADLTFAQNRAISSGSMKYVIFTLGTSTQSYSICNSNNVADPVTDPITQGVMLRTMGKTGASTFQNISIDAVATRFDSGTTLAFDSSGQPYSVNAGAASLLSHGSIKLVCGGESLTITIDPYCGELSVH